MQHLNYSSVFMFGVHKLDASLSSALKLFAFKFHFIHITKYTFYEAQKAYTQNIQGSLTYFAVLRPP